jgi:hypothetical protein
LENLDDFLENLKGDMDDSNISGLFKIDVIDEQMRMSSGKEN